MSVHVDIANLPATRTDPVQPTRDLAKLPMISAEQYQHVGRFAGALVLSTFEMIGGLPRMAQWADDNPTDFLYQALPQDDFTKPASRRQRDVDNRRCNHAARATE
jgi:hypothetical protein